MKAGRTMKVDGREFLQVAAATVALSSLSFVGRAARGGRAQLQVLISVPHHALGSVGKHLSELLKRRFVQGSQWSKPFGCAVAVAIRRSCSRGTMLPARPATRPLDG